MKFKIINLVTLLCTALLITACGREAFDDGRDESQGQIKLRGLMVYVDDASLTKAATNTSDFIVRIREEKSGTIQKEWVYSEMPEIATLKVGSYTVEALSHDVKPAEFEKPYYYDRNSFTIEENKLTQVESLLCKLSNIKVTIEYDMDLALLLGNDVAVNVTVGEGTLVFKKGEYRAGYFAASPSSDILTAELTGTFDSEPISITKVFTDVKAGQHRLIRYALQNTDQGGNKEEGEANLTVGIDASCTIIEKDVVVDVDEGVIEEEKPTDPSEPTDPEKPTDPENPDDAKAPKITGEGFDIKQQITVPADGMEIVVNINSEIGFKNLFVKIDSETLTSDILNDVGLASEFDLAYPGNLKEGLSGLGFPVEDAVIGEKYIRFDITQFTSLLGIYGAATHRFIITVVDQEDNKATETLTLITE